MGPKGGNQLQKSTGPTTIHTNYKHIINSPIALCPKPVSPSQYAKIPKLKQKLVYSQTLGVWIVSGQNSISHGKMWTKGFIFPV